MSKMKLGLASAVLLLAAACASPTPTPTPAPKATPPPAATATATPEPSRVPQSTAGIKPAAPPTQAPPEPTDAARPTPPPTRTATALPATTATATALPATTATPSRAAFPVTVGEPIAAELDSGPAFFSFEATAGKLYAIDITLGTLADSIAILYAAGQDGAYDELASNDDADATGASRIVWEATESDTYYVEVLGFGGALGTYTLTVSETDMAQDHADAIDGATGVAAGGTVEADLNSHTDIDFFSFEAQAGAVYRIEVVLGTLQDSVVTLWDAEGQELAHNDDYGSGGGSRIAWAATASATYYVEVFGFGGDLGTYTLAISELDVNDDHANSFEGATGIVVGQPAPGVLDYGGDSDVFSFEARESTVYEITVSLGTLAASAAILYTADGVELAYIVTASDHIVWEAPESTTYYVEVLVWDDAVGSYTLTIAVALDER